jgi:copper(I)-binding protein
VSSARRRRLTAVSLAAVAGLTLSACGTSFGAQTNQVYQPAVGANARGEVEAHNTQLVSNNDGSATLSAALVSNLDDSQMLSSVTVTDAAGQDLTVRNPKTPVELPSGELVTIGGKDGAFIVAEGAEAGAYVTITLTFSGAEELTVRAPVMPRSEHADEYGSVAGGDGLVPDEVSGTGAEDAATGAETESGPEGEADHR